jgi:predicted SAM-dependent methyltransferase
MEDFDHRGQRYDHITLSHVLEHTRDPTAIISRVARALAPGGRLWIATPNADARMFAALGPAARDIDFPRHRIILSRKALSEMLRSNGLQQRWMASPFVNTAMTLRTSIDNRSFPDNRLAIAGVITAIADTNRPPELVVFGQLENNMQSLREMG